MKRKNIVEITPSKINLNEVAESVGDDGSGATSLFVGTTRDNFKGKFVKRLEYEAYESMAIKEVKRVIVEARKKWNLFHVAVHHRTGVVPVRETSIVIAVSSAHRKDSLEAVQYLIDTIKATVPIWKKEVYSDGTSWKENAESRGDAVVGKTLNSSTRSTK